jgi:hypothetical protein
MRLLVVVALAACEAPAPPPPASVASEAAPSTSIAAAPPAPDDALSVTALADRHDSRPDLFDGTVVRVRGRYFARSEVTAGGATATVISVVSALDVPRPSISCALGKRPDDLVRGDAIVVRGKVASAGGVLLEECTYQKDAAPREP